ncbi:MAG: VanZ family protein [Anaerofustis stercorihominis]|nr:VanZ family protein [Anaerofustis stercorihominis]
MTSIISYLEDMLLYIPASVAVIVICRILRLRKLRENGIRSPFWREVIIVLFFTYMAAILSQTVFKDIGTFLDEGHLLINFRPFNFVYFCSSFEYLIINVLGNILLFVPMGMFVPVLWRGNAFFTGVGSGALFSLAIEIMQLPLLRTTDIDDLMLNTTGAFIGYLTYIMLRKKWPVIKEKFRVTRN